MAGHFLVTTCTTVCFGFHRTQHLISYVTWIAYHNYEDTIQCRIKIPYCQKQSFLAMETLISLGLITYTCTVYNNYYVRTIRAC